MEYLWFCYHKGISEYNQGNFDFSQECETAFLLPINDLNNTKAINKFLGIGRERGSKGYEKLRKSFKWPYGFQH